MGTTSTSARGRWSSGSSAPASARVELPDVFFRTTEWLEPGSLPADGSLYGDDLLGNAFFVLTRYEEAVLPDRDEHDRFPADASILVREGLIERPVVDEWAAALRQALGLEPAATALPGSSRATTSTTRSPPRASARRRSAAGSGAPPSPATRSTRST